MEESFCLNIRQQPHTTMAQRDRDVGRKAGDAKSGHDEPLSNACGWIGVRVTFRRQFEL